MSIMKKASGFVAAVTVGMAAVSAEAVIFSENFDAPSAASWSAINYAATATPQAPGQPLDGWAVLGSTGTTSGTGGVQHIANEFQPYIPLPMTGSILQLSVVDGAAGNQGGITRSLTTTPGTSYTITLLASQRGGWDYSAGEVIFGAETFSWNIPQPEVSGDPIGWKTLTFNTGPVAGASTTFSIRGLTVGGNGSYQVIDNITVSAIPEPATLGLALAGLAVLAGRRCA